MNEFLAQSFYGNTILQWLIAAGIAGGSVLVGKTVYRLTSGVIQNATRKTETEVDDFIVDTIGEPVVVVVTGLGFWISVQTLSLPVSVDAFLWVATEAAIVLSVTWALARVWDAFVSGWVTALVATIDSAVSYTNMTLQTLLLV